MGSHYQFNVGVVYKLNKQTLDTRKKDVKIGYHIIIHAFQNKDNLNNMIRNLTEKEINVQVIKETLVI